MAESTQRVGLIGLSAKGSWASQAHLPYFQRTSRYKITALGNSSQASGEAAAKTYSLSDVATYDNPASVAKDPNVDIVAVSVNVPRHYDLLRPALEAGKDVFSEWPLARNVAEAEELVRLAKEKQVKTMVGLQARQNPSIMKAKEIVASGKLGKVLGTTMFGHGLLFSGSAVTEDLSYMLPVEAGANILTIPFGHAVDALCYVMNSELGGITATLSNHYSEVDLLNKDGKLVEKRKKTSYDFVSITASLVNDGGNVAVTYAPGPSRSGRQFHWEIIGSEGTLVLEGPTGYVQMGQPTVKLAVGQEELKEIEVEKAADYSFNVGKAWDAWAGTRSEKGHSVTTWEDALVRHKMIEAIYRSAEQGTREDYV